MYSGVIIAYFKAFDANVFSPDRSSFCFLVWRQHLQNQCNSRQTQSSIYSSHTKTVPVPRKDILTLQHGPIWIGYNHPRQIIIFSPSPSHMSICPSQAWHPDDEKDDTLGLRSFKWPSSIQMFPHSTGPLNSMRNPHCLLGLVISKLRSPVHETCQNIPPSCTACRKKSQSISSWKLRTFGSNHKTSSEPV